MANEEIEVQVEKVEDAAQTWRQMLEDVRARTNEAKGNVVDQLLKFAETIREEARASDDEEAVEQAERMARSLEQTGLYLDTHTIEEIGEEIGAVVQRRPWLMVGVAFFVGLMVGMILGRR